jgi:transposase
MQAPLTDDVGHLGLV